MKLCIVCAHTTLAKQLAPWEPVFRCPTSMCMWGTAPSQGTLPWCTHFSCVFKLSEICLHPRITYQQLKSQISPVHEQYFRWGFNWSHSLVGLRGSIICNRSSSLLSQTLLMPNWIRTSQAHFLSFRKKNCKNTQIYHCQESWLRKTTGMELQVIRGFSVTCIMYS
jgi:hypothetical protein